MASVYVSTFSAEDKERLFAFLVLFSRWEAVLKRAGFLKPPNKGKGCLAEPAWDEWACAAEDLVSAVSGTDWERARSYLWDHPPKRQVLRDGAVLWADNPRRSSESDAQYLFRIVRDIRNNLFHGGKYPLPAGPVSELARDRELIDAATVVLEKSANLDPRLAHLFDEGS